MKKTPLPTIGEILLSLDAFVLVVGAGAVLAALLLFFSRNWGRFLPLMRVRRIYWQGAEVALCLLLFLLLPLGVIHLLQLFGVYHLVFGQDPTPTQRELLAWPPAFFLTLALVPATLYILSGTRLHELGISRTRWPQNVFMGYSTFVLITPALLAVFYLMILLDHGLGLGRFRLHPLAEMKVQHISWWEGALIVFQVGISAPILEELLFRGLLQAWLRRATLLGHWVILGLTWAVGFSNSLETAEKNDSSINYPLAVFTGLLFLGYLQVLNFYRARKLFQSPEDFGVKPQADDETPEGNLSEDNRSLAAAERWALQDGYQQRHKQWLSIFGSAMLWSIIHVNAWPAPVPLFFMGLALGWLAHRTQSLIPGIVTHSLFNLVATLQIFLGPAREF